MAFFTVNGTPIPCSPDGSSSSEVEETGSRERMFDATMMEAIRARKLTVALASTLATRAIAEGYKAALLAVPPIPCNGELFNNVATNCFIRYQGMSWMNTASGLRWRVRFIVYEA